MVWGNDRFQKGGKGDFERGATTKAATNRKRAFNP